MAQTTRISAGQSESSNAANDAPARRALHAYLTAEAHEAWHDFAATNGVSVSALLEALSNPLLTGFDGTVAEALDDSVMAARATDTARRRRGRNRT